MKIKPAKPLFGNIPAVLKERPQWVLWALEDGKKIPKTPKQKNAKSNDPATWSTFEAVKAAYNPKHFDGIGFVFAEGDGLTGVDLDSCRDPATGEIAGWAKKVLSGFGTYAEVSPSETGVKFIGQTDKDYSVLGFKSPVSEEHVIPGKAPQVEMYTDGRFFTITGRTVAGFEQLATDNLAERFQQFDKRYRKDKVSTSKGPKVFRDNPDQPDYVVAAARRFLEGFPAAISGSRGHDTTFAAACKLCIGFALSQRQAVEEMLDYNGKCDPEWSEDEIIHKVDNALKEPGVRGTEAPKWFGGKSAIELYSMADEPVGWIVENVFSEDQPTIFGAKQKSLKTTLLTDLAISVASGLPWLARFEVCRRRKVLFLTGEASEKAAIRKIKKAAHLRNIPIEEFGKSLRIEATAFPTLPKLGDCESIRAAIEHHGAELVILDPLYMGLSGLGTTNLFEVGPVLRQFMEFCRPASVIIAHHVKKSASYDDAPNLEDLSQAGIAEYAGNYWLMGRMSEYTGNGVHELAVRYGGRDEQFGLLKMSFNENTWRADISSLIAHREELKKRREDERVDTQASRILAALQESPSGMAMSSLASACGTKSTRPPFRAAVSQLRSDGVVELISGFKSGTKTCEGVRLIQ